MGQGAGREQAPDDGAVYVLRLRRDERQAFAEHAADALVEITLRCLAGQYDEAEAVARAFPHPQVLTGTLRRLAARLRTSAMVVARLADELGPGGPPQGGGGAA